MNVNRRDFLIRSALLSSSGIFAHRNYATDAVSGATKLLTKRSRVSDSYSPLIELSSFTGTTDISGDTPDEAHDVFWNKRGFIEKKGGYQRPVKHTML